MKTMTGTYIVTGGGSGTGRAVAKRLTQAGATVVVWGRTPDKLTETVAAGDAVAYFLLDISDAAQVARAFADAATRFGQISGFVHCAGIWTPGALTDVSDDVAVQTIATIVTGTALCLKGAVKAMSASGGRIAQIAAASAKPGFSETALNMLAKRAQDGLHEGLVQEIKNLKIRLTTIYPDNIAPTGSDRVSSGKAMSYDDVAEAIMWVLNVSDTVWVQEILLTAPNTPR